jgi:hypothetical protein
MALGFLIIRTLTPIYIRRFPPNSLRIIAIALFVVWLAYPLNNVQKYLRSAFDNGEVSEYNLYNTRALNESGIREFIQSLSINANDKIYSNYEPLAWFYTRRTILKLPQGPVSTEPPNPDEVLKNYPGWPGSDGAGYVIWMKELGFKEYVLSPAQLSSRADFHLLFTSKQGDVLLLTPKQP